MADDPNAADPATWPLLCFQVAGLGSSVGDFLEISGLDAETQLAEHRAGSSESLAPPKMPGSARGGNVTLKKRGFQGQSIQSLALCPRHE